MKLSPEILKQNAAALIAFAEGKPIEWQMSCGDWVATTDIQDSFFAFPHRPAPDPIAPGHNPDKLAVSQVGDGWRLVEASEGFEASHSGEWFKATEIHGYSDKWLKTNGHNGREAKWTCGTLRTRLTREELAALDKPAWQLPAPPAGQRWHREDFTEADLPEGWRPLLEGEIIQTGDEFDDQYITENWSAKSPSIGSECTRVNLKYRTRRPLPSAPVMVPLEVSDVSVGGVVFFTPQGSAQWPRYATATGVYFQDEVAYSRSYKQLQDQGWEWAIGTGERKPCTKEKK